MYYVLAVKTDLHPQLFYREFKNRSEACKLKQLLLCWNALHQYPAIKPFQNIQIRSSPYNESYGFFNIRLNDLTIRYIARDFRSRMFYYR